MPTVHYLFLKLAGEYIYCCLFLETSSFILINKHFCMDPFLSLLKEILFMCPYKLHIIVIYYIVMLISR